MIMPFPTSGRTADAIFQVCTRMTSLAYALYLMRHPLTRIHDLRENYEDKKNKETNKQTIKHQLFFKSSCQLERLKVRKVLRFLCFANQSVFCTSVL